MHLAELDALVEPMLVQHEGFTATLAGELAAIAEHFAPASLIAKRQLEEATAFHLLRHRQAMSTHIEAGVGRVLSDVFDEVDALGKATTHGRLIMQEWTLGAKGELHSAVELIVARERQSVLAMLRRQALARAVLRGSNDLGARQVEFLQPDRLGRQWSSQNYLRTTLRGALVGLHNDLIVLAVNRAGEDEVQVWHEDKGPVEMLSITGKSPALRLYEDARMDHFHPNTRALLRVVR